MNMKHNWSHFIGEISSMTNVTIICGDGIIHTHKIVVASASDFIKHLLSDIPVGDEITLYLPDHDKTSVMKLLDGVFTNDTIKHDDNQGSSIDFSSLVSVCEPVLLKVIFCFCQNSIVYLLKTTWLDQKKHIH